MQALEVRLVPLPHLPYVARPLGLRGSKVVEQPDKSRPILHRRRGRPKLSDGLHIIAPSGHALQYAASSRWPNARQQLKHPETRDPVGRIFGKAENAQHVLDVSRFEKSQA